MKKEGFWGTVYKDAVATEWCKMPPNPPLRTLIYTALVLAKNRPGFASVFWLRINQLFTRNNWRGHFRLKIWRFYRFSNDISDLADIGPGFFLPHPIDVTIGSRVVIGSNVTVYNGVTLGAKGKGSARGGMPRVGNNVTIYTGAKIIGDITIGDGSEIGAGAVCVRDVPANSVMYGIPPNVTIRPNSELVNES